MAVYSEVAVVFKKDFDVLVRDNAGEDILRLLQSADSVHSNEDAVRYYWKMTKWYEDESDQGLSEYELHQLLEKLDEDGDNYRVWKVTSEYIWDEASPLDTWGSYRNVEMDPCINVAMEPFNQ